MSDTPRTDEAVFLTIGAGYNSVDPNFARKLERENVELREQVEHLIGMIEQLESDLAHFATIEAFETKKETKP